MSVRKGSRGLAAVPVASSALVFVALTRGELADSRPLSSPHGGRP